MPIASNGINQTDPLHKNRYSLTNERAINLLARHAPPS